MATINPRINVTLGAEALDVLTWLAGKEKKSLSAKAGELISIALEMEEDWRDSRIADERLATAKKYYSHEEAWASLSGK